MKPVVWERATKWEKSRCSVRAVKREKPQSLERATETQKPII
jgi:hypothetical protein